MSILTLKTLADHKHLPVDVLRQSGVTESQRGLEIDYLDTAGNHIATKRRTALKAGEGSYWPAGQSLAAYGQWRVGEAQQTGILYLVEGESDVWTLWHYG